MHIIIDDYLDNATWDSLTSELDRLDTKAADNESKTAIENKKIVFKLNKLSQDIQSCVTRFASEDSKGYVKQLTGWNGQIYSLLQIDDFGGYAPYHTMQKDGFLGSHIDHTYTCNGDLIHIANCIFYAHRNWDSNWGGETVLFDRTGLTKNELVAPKPNRMIFFTHDAESFHGVEKVKCPLNEVRRTFYMDFYILKKDLKFFKQKFYEKNRTKYFYMPTLTTFIPLPKFDNKFELSAVKSPHFKSYLKNYLKYLVFNLYYKLKGFYNDRFI